MERLQKILSVVRQLWCDHEFMTHFAEKRIFLRCDYCGKESPGWEVERASIRKSDLGRVSTTG